LRVAATDETHTRSNITADFVLGAIGYLLALILAFPIGRWLGRLLFAP
jgi:hypothetical protein